jgi:hypothetical protein
MIPASSCFEILRCATALALQAFAALEAEDWKA